MHDEGDGEEVEEEEEEREVQAYTMRPQRCERSMIQFFCAADDFNYFFYIFSFSLHPFEKSYTHRHTQAPYTNHNIHFMCLNCK